MAPNSGYIEKVEEGLGISSKLLVSPLLTPKIILYRHPLRSSDSSHMVCFRFGFRLYLVFVRGCGLKFWIQRDKGL